MTESEVARPSFASRASTHFLNSRATLRRIIRPLAGPGTHHPRDLPTGARAGPTSPHGTLRLRRAAPSLAACSAFGSGLLDPAAARALVIACQSVSADVLDSELLSRHSFSAFGRLMILDSFIELAVAREVDNCPSPQLKAKAESGSAQPLVHHLHRLRQPELRPKYLKQRTIADAQHLAMGIVEAAGCAESVTYLAQLLSQTPNPVRPKKMRPLLLVQFALLHGQATYAAALADPADECAYARATVILHRHARNTLALLTALPKCQNRDGVTGRLLA
ncbi:hypothetical protein H696_02028 [Fonticula alba]|uniref:Uncharacterized protein n=1 Tax=Fonticula alba TaxID=691883 RepID=A0A058Z9W1_FONAL|nr:hypothetical protein H696_02028 [Fonticula alba]KCV71079.1 hypothetical protein H696_02028 [Fonticula alba]|eukprot:XP_009494202.1 hypothetical protein H696_02028 [Fonticula alba]